MNQPANEMTWKSLGACLEKSRRKQKMDLHDAASALRLPTRTLLAIEQGSCQGLPSIYLRGHVQRYISLLNQHDPSLDGVSAETLFQQQHDADSETAAGQKNLLPAALPPAPAQRLFDNALRIASYVVVTAGVVIPLVWWFTQGAVRMSFDETLVSTSAPVSTATASQDEAAEVASIRPGHFSASAAPFASMRPARSGNPGGQDMLSSQSLLPATYQLNDAATPAPRPPLRALPDADSVTASSASGLDLAAPGAVQLQLRMLNDSWVEISDAAGERVEFDLLRSGQSHQYLVQLPLDILIGKASAVDVMLNGMPVDLSPHTRGNVAKLKLAELPSPR